MDGAWICLLSWRGDSSTLHLCYALHGKAGHSEHADGMHRLQKIHAVMTDSAVLDVGWGELG